jgi:hypothetical protein
VAAVTGDHVRVRPPGTVYCEECGWSYSWNLPVSISIFVAGNRVVEQQHQDCAIYRQDWRRRLLRTLLTRIPLNIGPADES